MNHWLRRMFWLLGGLLIAQVLVRLWVLLRPWPTPMVFAPLLKSDIRRRYRDPAQTLAPLELTPGMRVLEIGPGTGLFSSEVARQIGADGMLLGLDVQPPMLRRLHYDLSADTSCQRMSLVAGNAIRLPFGDTVFDAAVLIAVLPMMPDRVQALRELRRVLRSGAAVLISEDLVAPEYVPPVVTKHWLRQAGLTTVKQVDGFWCYSIVAKKRMSG